MELSRLTAKQKRYQSWKSFNEEISIKNSLKEATSNLLDQYQSLLAKCWTESQISPAAERLMLNLERELTQLNEEARKTNYK